jgi:hypothetical protein
VRGRGREGGREGERGRGTERGRERQRQREAETELSSVLMVCAYCVKGVDEGGGGVVGVVGWWDGGVVVVGMGVGCVRIQIFTIIFVVELLVNIYAHWFRGFFFNGWEAG